MNRRCNSPGWSWRNSTICAKNNNTSELDLQRAETNYAQVQAAISADRATLAKLQVRAPFDGHLGLRQVSLGQYIETSTAVVDLQQWDPIYAQFQVPQQQLARLAAAQTARLRVAGIDGRDFSGTITAIGAGQTAPGRSDQHRTSPRGRRPGRCRGAGRCGW
ncbi:MAG: efflux RND transporter periplasmic adaptor subunit [Halioglobus sp.]|nr:efflux RND transporter periplasmic adaptor subunit [Halioglobus sp.]